MPNLPSVTKSKLAVHSEIDTQPLNLSWLDRPRTFRDQVTCRKAWNYDPVFLDYTPFCQFSTYFYSAFLRVEKWCNCLSGSVVSRRNGYRGICAEASAHFPKAIWN